MQAEDVIALINRTPPPVVVTLNGRAVAWDAQTETLTLAFTIEPSFANRANAVQGGIVTTMLDAAMGIAIAATRTNMTNVPTLDLSVRFLAPTPLGELTCTGRILRAGRRVAFTRGELLAPDGTVTAESSATSLLP